MIFANVTLESDDLAVTVFLPRGIKEDEPAYYYASRFEHGSMVGNIKRKVGDVEHTLFQSDVWRAPHNSHWPESGVGLASEFGVGDDGGWCFYRCGWPGAEGVTNGLLGYNDAKLGGSFLKIGVGALIKGSCPACDSAEEYKFNSPYLFASPPKWSMSQDSGDSLRLEHSATLDKYGYRLVKDISLHGNILTVTSTLTNLGSEHFRTAWYSHHFFNCDGVAVGPGYSIDLDLKGDGSTLYQEPGTWSWSTPLLQYANVLGLPDAIRVAMTRALQPGVRIKTEFVNDGSTNGGFNLNACQTNIIASFPEVESGTIPMYAYNFYAERATFSPEPQLLLELDPGASKSWTQVLQISDLVEEQSIVSFQSVVSGIRWGAAAELETHQAVSPKPLAACIVVVAVATVLVINFVWSARTRRRSYARIPDST